MAPKTSTFFDLKTCLGKSYRHSTCLSISQPPSKPGSRGTCSTPKKVQLCTHLATVPLWEHQPQKPQKHISTLTQISVWSNTSRRHRLSKPAYISDSHPPRESDHDTEILSQSTTEAFQRLIDAIDNPSPTNV